MSLAQYESSRYSGQPINLYFFQYGESSTQFFAYTDAEEEIPFGGFSYLPLAIDRGKITSSGSLDKTNVTITTPHDIALANLYLIYPPSSVTSLIIYQGHIGDADVDFKVIWTGRVMSCSRKGSTAEFNCEPISTSLRRNGLRRRYQFGCPHVLYGSDCRANKATSSVTAYVQAVRGSRITLALDWPGLTQADKYLQGLAEWSNDAGTREIRTILRVENGGLTFLVSGVVQGLDVGGAVSMVLGCNHKSGTDAQPDGDCGPLHSNILNFGGQERIPFKNPIGLVNSFY